MSPVKAAPLDPVVLAARFESAGRAAGFRVERYGEIVGCPLFALTKRTPGPRPRLYLSAGIHGDEPAGPLALLSMLEDGVFDHRATWFLCPLLNPAGHTAGLRENANGLDLNRDYLDLRSLEIAAHVAWLRRQPSFDCTFCLHEDWESSGYYLYELNPLGRPSFARAMIDSVLPFCPVDPSAIIDGRAVAEPGIIRPVDDPLMRETWPESIYLRAHHATLSYTTETPSSFPMAQRIAAQRTALKTAFKLSTRDPRKIP